MEYQARVVALKAHMSSDSGYILKAELRGTADRCGISEKKRKKVRFQGFVLSNWYMRLSKDEAVAGWGDGKKLETPNIHLTGEIKKVAHKCIHSLVNEIHSWPP